MGVIRLAFSERDQVLRQRLGIMICDKDGSVGHFINSRVITQKGSGLAVRHDCILASNMTFSDSNTCYQQVSAKDKLSLQLR